MLSITWFDQAIVRGEFPDELKLTDVTPTFKKDDPTSVKNNSLISVLPAVSKIYERIIRKQIAKFMDKYLSPYLCGYRKGYNSQYALVSLMEKVVRQAWLSCSCIDGFVYGIRYSQS